MKRAASYFLIIVLFLSQTGIAIGEKAEESVVEPEYNCITDQILIEELHNELLQKKAVELQDEIGIATLSMMPELKNISLMPSKGEVNMLVIPIGYPDLPDYREGFNKAQTYEQFFSPYDPNEKAYEQSVRGFYQLASYGQLDLVGDIMDPYEAPKQSAYYYGDVQGRSWELLVEAIEYYVEQGIDLSKYDNDGDGILDAVFIRSLCQNSWHYTAYHSPTEVGGYTVETYVFSSMIMYDNGLECFPEECRVSEHEIGHLMGLPDNRYVYGIENVWEHSLSELTTGTSFICGYINAYYKYLLGWIEPLILTGEDAVLDLELASVEPYSNEANLPRAVVIIPNTSAFPFSEYYFAEYRSGGMYRRPGSVPIYDNTPGLVLWHASTFLTSNGQYRSEYRTNYLKPVYKSGTEKYNTKDIYVEGDEFSARTTPNSDFYDGTSTGIYLKVTDITPEKACIRAGFETLNLYPEPTIEISTPSKRVLRKGETATVVITTRVGDKLLELDENQAKAIRSYSTSGTITGAGVASSALKNPMTVTFPGYSFPGLGDGTIWIDIPAGAVRYQGKDSAAVMSEVIYIDNTPPEITLLGVDPQVVWLDEPYEDPGAQATDNMDSDVAEKLVVDTSKVNINVPGTYVVSYTVTDHAGHTATAKRNVVVKEQPHIHSYSNNWNCDEANHWHECECGEKIDTATHTEDSGTVTKQPTLDEEGTKAYACSVCGYAMRTETLPKLEPEHTHSYSETWKMSRTDHWKECECGEKNDQAAHVPVTNAAVPATCTTPGKTEGSHCGVCGYVIVPQTTVPALAHNFSGDWLCDETGHWHKCEDCDATGDATAHTEDSGTVTKQPTLDEEGTKAYACSVCGYAMRTETLPKLTPEHTHSYSETWKMSRTDHWKECECGEKDQQAAHVPVTDAAVPATCAAPGKTEGSHCGVCGYVIVPQTTVPATGHSWDEGHVTTAPSCTDKGVKTFACAACAATKKQGIDPVGHSYSTDWSHDTVHHWHKCGACGLASDKAVHSYGNWTTTKAPTATAKGRKERDCTVCAYKETQDIPAKGGGGGGGSGGGGGGSSPSGGSGSGTVAVVPAAPTELPPATRKFFEDVGEKDWFHDDVYRACGQGWMEGTSDTTFSPGMSTTRAMIATLLWRLEGSPPQETESDFPDVAEGRWYTQAVCWAAGTGVVQGYGDGSYGPDDVITREQLALMLYRYAKAGPVGDGLSAFADGDTVSPWAKDAMAWAVERGILTGKSGGCLDPQGHATRAETAAVLVRYANR